MALVFERDLNTAKMYVHVFTVKFPGQMVERINTQTKNYNSMSQHLPFTVADLGFPRGGCADHKGGRQPTICLIFPENCMKMKKFGPRGGGGASLV